MRLHTHKNVDPDDSSPPYGGTFFKGGPKTTSGEGRDKKTRPGQNRDRFRLKAANPAIAKAYHDTFVIEGQEPFELPIERLAFPEIERSWSTYRSEHDSKGLVHQCNGLNCRRLRLPSGKIMTYTIGQMEAGTSPKCPHHDKEDGQKGCKPKGQLVFYLQGFPIDATFVCRTSSINDIENITQELLYIESLYGSPTQIPLILSRVNRKINKKFKGQMILSDEWLLSIRVNDTYARARKLIKGISPNQTEPVALGFIPERPKLPEAGEERPEPITFQTHEKWVSFKAYIFNIPYEKPMQEWYATLASAEAFMVRLIRDGHIPNGNLAINATELEVAIARERFQVLMETHTDPGSPCPKPDDSIKVEVVNDNGGNQDGNQDNRNAES